MIYAEILAGGKGTRLGKTEMPKQFLKIDNKPIIIRTIEKFIECELVDKIIICCLEEWKEYLLSLIEQYMPNDKEKIDVVIGGSDRSSSIISGCNHIKENYGIDENDIIITHDAVRPFVTNRIIMDNINAMEEYSAANTIVPTIDTIVRSSNNLEVTEIPVRDELYNGQTPQTFNLAKLMEAYDSISDEQKLQLTDACKVMLYSGEKIKIIEGDYTNIKVTTSSDLQVANVIVENERKLINTRFRLVEKGVFENFKIEEIINSNSIVVKPTVLSLCAADMRYYNGTRPAEVLKQKLPLTLIHEAVGEVIYDPTNELIPGTKVVMLPLIEETTEKSIRSNYDPKNKFRSSTTDGFMQKFCVMKKSEVIIYDNIEEEIAVFSELLSVVFNTINSFSRATNLHEVNNLGIWGSGTLGYLTALVFHKMYNHIDLNLFGSSAKQLDCFDFVSNRYVVGSNLNNVTVDHAFECVGGFNSGLAINQIIDLIRPQGVISLMGVSENPIDINTRMILEKGLIMVGNSRSNYNDFSKAIKFLMSDQEISKYIKRLISQIIEVNSLNDMYTAFDQEGHQRFKTLMKWNPK